MLISTLSMAFLALVLLGIGYWQGEKHIQGLHFALKLFFKIAPLLFFAFVIAGMLNVLIPKEWVARSVGSDSGMKGVIIGTLLGTVAPAPPYVSMPIVASLLSAGASAGTMVAFMSSWALLSVNRLAMEIGFLGWKFTGLRIACSFFVPLITGMIAYWFTQNT